MNVQWQMIILAGLHSRVYVAQPTRETKEKLLLRQQSPSTRKEKKKEEEAKAKYSFPQSAFRRELVEYKIPRRRV